jgi:hypothetical protein
MRNAYIAAAMAMVLVVTSGGAAAAQEPDENTAQLGRTASRMEG